MLFYKKEVPRYLILTTNILILLYTVSLIYFIFFGESFQIAPCFCSLMLTVFIRFTTKKFINVISPILIFSILIFILFSSYLGSCFDFYGIVNHYDDIMHSLSGVLAILFAYDAFALLNSSSNSIFDRRVIIVFVFCFSMAIAGLWEISEFLIDSFFATNMQVGGLADTMHDMIDAFIASIITIPLYESFYKKYK
ncbi:hypothetical protein [Paraclostridium dentum]|uniref:hypothetical protein n=1 Tax=Paraclostridium dentum TaxID=2662455 RepID=UPI003B0015D5